MILTTEQLSGMMPFATRKSIITFIDPINNTLAHFSINTPKRVAAFIAQIAHESGSLRYVRELASGEAYDTGNLAIKLGNTPEKDGDGQRYKGRGLIQITGTSNYKAVSKYFDIDFFANPQLLESPHWATMSAGWYWELKNLNQLADMDDFRMITIKINGGLNGYADRQKHWIRCKKVLGIL